MVELRWVTRSVPAPEFGNNMVRSVNVLQYRSLPITEKENGQIAIHLKIGDWKDVPHATLDDQFIDKGPWEVSPDGRNVYSDDFTHDVHLTVHGDFYDDNDRKRYSDQLAAVLNGRNSK